MFGRPALCCPRNAVPSAKTPVDFRNARRSTRRSNRVMAIPIVSAVGVSRRLPPANPGPHRFHHNTRGFFSSPANPQSTASCTGSTSKPVPPQFVSATPQPIISQRVRGVLASPPRKKGRSEDALAPPRPLTTESNPEPRPNHSPRRHLPPTTSAKKPGREENAKSRQIQTRTQGSIPTNLFKSMDYWKSTRSAVRQKNHQIQTDKRRLRRLFPLRFSSTVRLVPGIYAFRWRYFIPATAARPESISTTVLGSGISPVGSGGVSPAYAPSIQRSESSPSSSAFTTPK